MVDVLLGLYVNANSLDSPWNVKGYNMHKRFKKKKY